MNLCSWSTKQLFITIMVHTDTDLNTMAPNITCPGIPTKWFGFQPWLARSIALCSWAKHLSFTYSKLLSHDKLKVGMCECLGKLLATNRTNLSIFFIQCLSLLAYLLRVTLQQASIPSRKEMYTGNYNVHWITQRMPQSDLHSTVSVSIADLNKGVSFASK